MKKRLAVIGAGQIVPYHLDAFKSLGLDFTAISARSRSKNLQYISEKYEFQKTYENWKDMVSEADADFILVCTPPEISSEILKFLLPSDKKILVEKPVALRPESIKDIVDLGYDNVSVAYNRRFYESVEILKNNLDLKNGYLNVKIVENKFSTLDELFLILHENSVHLLELINYLVPYASFTNMKLLNGKIGVSAEILQNGEKIIGNLLVKFGTYENSEISFTSQAISMNLKPIEILTLANGLEVIEPTSENPIRLYQPTWVGNGQGKVISKTNYKPGFYRQAETFVNKKDPVSGIDMCNLKGAMQTLVLAKSIFSFMEKYYAKS